MSYVESTLLRDERVIHKAKVHWFVYFPAMFWFAMTGVVQGPDNRESTLGGIFAMLFFYYLARAIVLRRSTELAITSKRVVAKFGFISRKTVELNHSKIESFNVQQGVLGRLFDFGKVTISGTGGMRAPIPAIADPLEFRRQAAIAVDASQSVSEATSKAA